MQRFLTTWSRYRDRLIRAASTAALFTTATLVAVHGILHPHTLPLPAPIPALSAVRPVPAGLAGLSAPAAPAPVAPVLADLRNPHVDTWVFRFTTSLRTDFAAALQRKAAFAGMIESRLEAHGMPRQLVYLALIESQYEPKARSRASAVGLWQFMSGTARRFGLHVGRGVDQRTDPAKETDAALAYLGTLHDQFGSWYLAAAAYNAGPGTVTRALERVLGRATGSDSDFYRIAGHLPAETREYVPKLIAAARIGGDPASYGF